MTTLTENPPAATGTSARWAAASELDRAREGDVRAWGAIYRAHAGRVHAICLRIHAGRREDAEDSVQEAFVRAWQRLPGFRGDAAFGTWLHRIAVNSALDRLRAEQRRNERIGGEEGTDAAERVADRSRSPETRLDLEQAIAGLPERARLAFVLHDVEGWKHREIAEMTGTAEGTWKSQLHRARRLLREALEQ